VVSLGDLLVLDFFRQEARLDREALWCMEFMAAELSGNADGLGAAISHGRRGR
jgi:hypothetical protein